MEFLGDFQPQITVDILDEQVQRLSDQLDGRDGVAVTVKSDRYDLLAVTLLAARRARRPVLVMDSAARAPEVSALMERVGSDCLIEPADSSRHWSLNLRRAQSRVLDGLSDHVLLASSGTTGVPKLVIRRAASLDEEVLSTHRALGIDRSANFTLVVAVSPSYAFGFVQGLWAVMEAGGRCYQLRTHTASALERALSAVSSTLLLAPPGLIGVWSRREPRTTCHAGVALTGGTPLAESVRLDFQTRWRTPVRELYGSTEAGVVAMTDSEGRMKLLPEVDSRVDDKNELSVRSPFSGTLLNDDRAAREWVALGDRVQVSPGGYLSLGGRVDSGIDLNGRLVDPHEIELATLTISGVVEAKIVELVRASKKQLVLFYAGSLSKQVVIQELSSIVSPHKVPARAVHLPELPKTVRGKIDVDRLRLEFGIEDASVASL
ncbi:class I adenylate-forming enzyme family protein [Nocardioides sp. SYSU D00038]|uniref:AMP-binding protein n=1 Tax=Nocardioides sp. SYSU D00038 TaxID=2812554 RepID=UPI001967FFA1|nr:class I adenylate-forming enzyme family protein [Nocardioides sp. SYSU D00038]